MRGISASYSGPIIAVGVITVCYTLIGGIEAVIWADVVQGFVLWLGIFICLAYLLFLPPGGPLATLQMAWDAHKISLGSMAPDLAKPTFLVLSLYGFFFYLQKYTADQTIVQRYLVARSDRGALKGIAHRHDPRKARIARHDTIEHVVHVGAHVAQVGGLREAKPWISLDGIRFRA